jgi:hypothetical protein
MEGIDDDARVVLFAACITNRAGILILVSFSGLVLPTSDQITGDSRMTLAMIDCHHNV